MAGGVAGSYDAELAFTRSTDVGPDDARPGLLRARTLAPEHQKTQQSFDLRRCVVHDLDADGAPKPDLVRLGFDVVDLAPFAELQEALECVRAAGRITDADARRVRRGLTGASLRLSDGSTLRLLAIASEGLIMRNAGPNGTSVTTGPRSGMNGHDAATAVHADQDVKGTPLRQILRGAAPWLFRYDTPDARNGWSPLMLLNLWIPLQQITRPLVLMDKRTLDRRAHQLRYGLPTDSFLERDEDQRTNDIWTFLPDAGQRWYFSSDMDARRAYVFETLGTPHGSFVVPGEDVSERLSRALARAAATLRRKDETALRREVDDAAAAAAPSVTTPALRRAIDAMVRLLEEARGDAAALCRGEGCDDWLLRAKEATDCAVRRSIEMRVVALRVPKVWGPALARFRSAARSARRSGGR
jgi:hypothetical protein